MLVENQKIEIVWNPQQASHFRKLGYKFEKGDIIYVPPEDLQYNSHKRVKVYCDNCGKELGMEYRQYMHKREKFNGNYYCDACASGATETKNKRKETCIKKYGVENPMQVEEIRKKFNESLSKNGSVPTSSQQLKIYEMIKNEYENCEINYPISWFNLDCYVKINDVNIDVEYDGWYWHQDIYKDIKRDNIIYKKGFKVLRIKSGYAIPSKEQLFEGLRILSETDKNYYEIIMEDYALKDK